LNFEQGLEEEKTFLHLTGKGIWIPTFSSHLLFLVHGRGGSQKRGFFLGVQKEEQQGAALKKKKEDPPIAFQWDEGKSYPSYNTKGKKKSTLLQNPPKKEGHLTSSSIEEKGGGGVPYLYHNHFFRKKKKRKRKGEKGQKTGDTDHQTKREGCPVKFL